VTIASTLRRAPVALTLLCVVLFYGWMATGWGRFEAGRTGKGRYNLLTDALLHGQLHLRVEPRPELFELADPYESRRNEPYRLQDASLYKGRYYLYFGVAPAVTFFLPARLLGLGDLPESLAAFLFATGGLVFATLILRELVAPGSPWGWAAAVCLLGFANVAPCVLRRPLVYEVAVSAGLFFLTGAAWAFSTAENDGRVSLGRLALGSVFLGCAIGSRPNDLVAVPFLLLLAWPAIRGRGRRSLPAWLAAVGPLAVVLLLLGLYNRARFGSWSEFGVSYVLTGTRVRFLQLSALPEALYFHFVAPAALRPQFPFVFPDDRYPWSSPAVFFNEPTAGLLWHSPFVLALLLAPWLLRSKPDPLSPRQRRNLAVLAALGLAQPLLTNLAFPAVAMRYQMDFATFLAVPALALWLLAERRANGRARWAIRTLGAVMVAWTCLTMTAMSLTDQESAGRDSAGGDSVLRARNPSLFARLERLAEPLRMAAGRAFPAGPRVTVRFRAAVPERLSADQEPLLSSGSVQRYDVLWLRSAAPGRWRLALAPAGGSLQLSGEFSLEPNAFHAFDVELDRVQPCVAVRVDGVPVAGMASPLEPLDERTIALGRGPRGSGAPELGRFSGTILSAAFLAAAAPGLEKAPPISDRPAILTEPGAPAPSRPVLGQLWLPADKEGAYLACASGWRWIPRYALDRVVVERPMSPRWRTPAGSVEAIVSSGTPAAGDTVVARHLAGGQFAFAIAHWDGRTWRVGPPGPTQPASQRERLLRVTLDRPAGLVLVDLDGSPALRAKAELAPILRGGLRPGPLRGEGVLPLE